MFQINDDKSIYVTRGDCCEIPIEHQLKSGDVVRFKVTNKKDCNTVVLQRDFTIESAVDTFVISLDGVDTKIGEVISKPTDYWYEVELNPDTNPQTIIGYDEDGAKILKLFPEGKDVDAEDIEVVGKKTLQELVDYALEQAKESGEFNGKDGENGADGQDGKDGYTPVKGKDYFTEEDKAEVVEAVVLEKLPLYSNALKGTASGEIVRVDDVSPIEHKTSVYVRSKNYANMSKLLNGNLVDNGDGSYTLTKIDGTRFSAEYVLNRPIPAGTLITASIASYEGTAPTMTIQVLKADRKDMYYFVVNESAKVKSTVLPYDVARVRVCFNNSEADGVYATFSGLQIETGEATEYEPYIDPATVIVTRCGKNLIPYPFEQGSTTTNGITFTDNKDGTITVNGTATSNVYYWYIVQRSDKLTVPKGTYFFYNNVPSCTVSTYYCACAVVNQATGEMTIHHDFGKGALLELTDQSTVGFCVSVVSGTELSNVLFQPQLEKGDRATAFAPYTEALYRPSADGTCAIPSLSPVMTLSTDTDGVTTECEYNRDINSLVKVKPARIGSVYLPASAWEGSGSLHSQVVEIDGATENSQVDLTPSVEQLAIFYDKSIAFVTENEDGVVTVYAIGQKPENDYTIQVTITEVYV